MDRIQRDVMIAAPPEVVWEVITQPEHVTQWFAERADFEAKPGTNGTMSWEQFGTYEMRVEDADPPRRFSFRWDFKEGSSLLVEFTLTEEDGGTRLRLVESGFEARGSDGAEHEGGWTKYLKQLREYAEAR